MGGMHYGSVETSPLLKKTLELLAAGGVRSTLDIAQATHSMAVHSDIAALRKNKIPIRRHYLGLQNGRRVFGYELEEGAAK